MTKMKGRYLSILLLLAIIAVSELAAEKRDYLDEYFDKVVSSFQQEIDKIGINSLKIDDKTFNVNRTVSSIPLLGTVQYKNFLLVDVATLEARSDGHRGTPDDDGVHLTYQINFPNITIFADVIAALDPLGEDHGTAQLIFEETVIAVQIDKNYTLGTSEISSSTFATGGPSTNFNPDSTVLNAAARIARLELGYELMWDQMNFWCNSTFTPMLRTITNNIEFPMFPPSPTS